MRDSPHYPVMLNEVLEYLSPRSGKIYVDGTFGAGGYSRAILESCDCTVLAIDRDESAFEVAEELKKEFPKRFVFMSGCFGDVEALLGGVGYTQVDGLVLDLGVSSMQLDQAERGFSFRFDGPLDMRMGQQSSDRSAADLVNNLDEKELANIIYKYGEERHSRRIAKAIVVRRAERPFENTIDLADLVRDVLPFSKKDKIDPATRTFQALRIAVNDELGELERALSVCENILSEDGRLLIVTFHSLEDRIVKNDFKAKAGLDKTVSRYEPIIMDAPKVPDFSLLSKKAILASDREISENSRSRSAKLRAIEKIAGAA